MKMLENLEYCVACDGCGVLFFDGGKVQPCHTCCKFTNDREAAAAVEELVRGAYANHSKAIRDGVSLLPNSFGEEAELLRKGIETVVEAWKAPFYSCGDVRTMVEVLERVLQISSIDSTHYVSKHPNVPLQGSAADFVNELFSRVGKPKEKKS